MADWCAMVAPRDEGGRGSTGPSSEGEGRMMSMDVVPKGMLPVRSVVVGVDAGGRMVMVSDHRCGWERAISAPSRAIPLWRCRWTHPHHRRRCMRLSPLAALALFAPACAPPAESPATAASAEPLAAAALDSVRAVETASAAAPTASGATWWTCSAAPRPPRRSPRL